MSCLLGFSYFSLHPLILAQVQGLLSIPDQTPHLSLPPADV